ncbi:methyltransferase domain-containing protein [Natronomonas halophila]|uniref:class I SAM-dependent methyltransferase n=1 Tax=Natronomonas halophila TaxID=2747817 RepID=UPI0015B6AC06|nr:methyltransferase domain-containing protein [Natronomonas halophila]QLD86415.1 methyltransferase domain-containing protein [Natronomonas halophila]
MAIAEFYGRWADCYDRIATAPGVGRWRRAAAAAVASPGDTIVEMGCGTGANLPYLRERVGPEGHVIGLDITPELLDRARRRAVEYDNVEVLRADATRPPFGGGDGTNIDAIVGSFVCGMFEDPAAVVGDWCDVVGTGGRIALLEATATDELLGRPLNPLFRAFTAVGAPGTDAWDVLRAPFRGVDTVLSERVSAAQSVLADRTVERRHETFALGFVDLLSGRVR